MLGAFNPQMVTAKVARAEPQEADVRQFAPPAAYISSRQPCYGQHALLNAVFGNGHPAAYSLLIATNLPTPEGWTVWLTVSTLNLGSPD